MPAKETMTQTVHYTKKEMFTVVEVSSECPENRSLSS
jgi:hypothetical protein